MTLRNDQKLLIFAAVLSVGVWVVPFLRPLILPLIYFNTHIHELGHALAAIATGGQVQHIHVYASGSGVTPVQGGSLFLLATSGYVGSSIAGGLMILGSRNEQTARRTLWITFGFMAFSMLFFVRGDWVGFLSGLLWTALLGLAAKFVKRDGTVFLTQFLGLSLCLTSLQAFLVLLNLTAANPSGHNDAKLLQDATLIPGIVWATIWLGISAAAITASLKAAWKPAKLPKRNYPR